jgi:hypothetical protein
MQRLVDALAKDEKEVRARIKALSEEATSLYALRNDVAHATVSVIHLPHDGRIGVCLRNAEWAERTQATLNKERDAAVTREEHAAYLRKVKESWTLLGGEKNYTFDQLESASERLLSIFTDFNEVTANVPIFGEELLPVATPRPR